MIFETTFVNPIKNTRLHTTPNRSFFASSDCFLFLRHYNNPFVARKKQTQDVAKPC